MKRPVRTRDYASLLTVLCALSGGCTDDYEKLNDKLGPAPRDAGADAGAGATVSDAGTASDAGTGNPSVTIEQGPVQGSLDGTINQFLGIPYAKPPVGELRWKLPVKPDNWTTPLAATSWGKRCAQNASQVLMNPASADEDCLYLNVWTPNLKPAKPLPVMFWIHGGGNQNGSASEFVPYTMESDGFRFYTGKYLAQKDVVVVSINYRLGAFGFFAHPSIASEPGGAPGNQGLYDQAFALEWVKTNIAKFGGDPSKVTIFGESAGSLDVCYHMASPKSRGLFHGAISQSGGCTTKQKSLADGQMEQGGRLAAALGCSDVACLRSKSVADILAVTTGGTGPTYSAVIDGTNGFLPNEVRKLFDAGEIAKVPYMLGSNSDEGTLFTLLTSVADEAALRTALMTQFPGADIDAILAVYPADQFPGASGPKDRLARIVGDARLVCSTYDSAMRAAAVPGFPGVWTYNFDVPAMVASMPMLKLGATHGAELVFVFGTSPTLMSGTPVFSAENKVVSDRMMTHWTNFAKTGDPNAGQPEWPKFSASSNLRMNFGAQSSTVLTDFRKAECDLWRLGYDRQFM